MVIFAIFIDLPDALGIIVTSLTLCLLWTMKVLSSSQEGQSSPAHTGQTSQVLLYGVLKAKSHNSHDFSKADWGLVDLFWQTIDITYKVKMLMKYQLC